MSGGFHYGFKVAAGAENGARATRTSYIYNLGPASANGWRLGAPLPLDLFGAAVAQNEADQSFLLVGGGTGYEVIKTYICHMQLKK